MDAHFCMDDSPRFRWIELDEITSTNQFLKQYQSSPEMPMTLVTAEYQTSGRGSGNNTWESARSENLLFSILVHPRFVEAQSMFSLSEVVALSVCDALSEYTEGIRIKWPNDIYYHDRKMVGMLIENVLEGNHVGRCVMGVGLNVNQMEFHSDAPNPVSLAQVLGHQVERRFVLERVMEHFCHYYRLLEQGGSEEIHTRYLSLLYRRGEWHKYRDKEGEFRANLVEVEPSGYLVLEDEKGVLHRYEFKEVKYII